MPGRDGDDGENGNPGLNGTDGSKIVVTESGPPASGTVTGDFYIDRSTAKLYGPKAGATWPTQAVDLKGPAGSITRTAPQGDLLMGEFTYDPLNP